MCVVYRVVCKCFKMREYTDTIQELTTLLNSNRRKGKVEQFKGLVVDLKKLYGMEISKKFLKNLYTEKDNNKKTARLNYLIRKAGFKVKSLNRYFNEMRTDKFFKTIIDFGKKDGFGNLKDVRKIQVGRFYKAVRRECFKLLVVENE